ncbi:hypothetical protein LCGC14_1908270 [marine sediment metagenome]|uniref:Resolvase/invertase-type recombinase catalytic domain-containing protein n=1 Tax=marine sediment metagenome TaxID=412755 RepID=A0A0F9FUE9_9ZZZZ
MKVAIYVRVSGTKKKLDGERRQDVNRQIEVIEKYLKRAGIKEWKVYCDDGKSAFTEDLNQRPAFKQLLNDCLRHYINEIYIEDITRFSRNLTIGIKWLKKLSDLNVNIISLKEGQLDYTSSKGWLQSNIFLLFAEWESRIRSEKVKSGMERVKKESGKTFGRPKINRRDK